MNAADRAPVDHLDVAAIGATIRIRFAPDVTGEVRQRVLEAWSGAIAEAGVPDAVVDVDSVTAVEPMLERLSVRVTLAALEHQRGALIMMHAAGIATDDGRVVAFVGPSGRGKTTLSATVATHFGYVSDETVAVDDDLNVLAYRKPLSRKRSQGPKEQVSPSRAGLSELPAAPLRLAALVLLDRQEQAAAPTVSRVPVIDAIGELVPQLSYVTDLEHPLQRLARLCDSVGGVWRLTYGEASTVVPLVPELLRSAPTTVDAWVALAPRATEPTAATAEYRWGPISDAIAADGSVAVISDGVLRVLAGIAPSIWLGVRRGLTFDQLVAQVVAEFDQPPQGDAAELVAAALDELLRSGLVVREDRAG